MILRTTSLRSKICVNALLAQSTQVPNLASWAYTIQAALEGGPGLAKRGHRRFVPAMPHGAEELACGLLQRAAHRWAVLHALRRHPPEKAAITGLRHHARHVQLRLCAAQHGFHPSLVTSEGQTKRPPRSAQGLNRSLATPSADSAGPTPQVATFKGFSVIIPVFAK